MKTSSQFIQLLANEASASTVSFSNPVTGAVWLVSFNEEELLVKVPNFSFKLSALNSTHFQPIDSLINLEFEFEPSHLSHPLFMHIYAKGIKRATFKVFSSEA